jgi:hypothetical protein
MPVFDDLAPGTYNVWVSNQDGTCPVSWNNQITLTEPEAATILSVNFSNPTNCDVNDGSITIQANLQNLLYSIHGAEGPWQENNTFGQLTENYYQVWVSNLDGSCQIQWESVIHLESPLAPTIEDVFGIHPSNCGAADGSIVITVSGGSGGYLFSLSGIEGSWQYSNSFPGLSAGSYQVWVSNQDGSCPTQSSTIVQLTTPSTPEISQVSVTQITDCDLSNGIISIHSTAQLFSIYGPEGPWSESPLFTQLQAGYYNVWVADSSTECSTQWSELVHIYEPSRPAIIKVEFAHPSDCQDNNGFISILATGASSPLLYSINGLQGPWYDSSVFEGLSGGTYDIWVSNADTICVVNWHDPISLESPELPDIQNVFTTNPSDCDSLNGSISIVGTGDEYSIDGNYWSGDPNFSDLGSGIYTVIARTSGCTTLWPDTIVMTVPQSPYISDVSVTLPTDCVTNNATLLIYGFSTSGQNIQYSIRENEWTENPLFENLEPGTYFPAIRNIDGSCTQTYQLPVIIDPFQFPDIVNASLVVHDSCMLSSAHLVIHVDSIIADIEYSITGAEGPWQSSPVFDNIVANTYLPAVRLLSGNCLSIGDSLAVSLGEFPQIDSITISQLPDCNGENATIQFHADNPLRYLYSLDGGILWQNLHDINPLSVGHYSFIVRDSSTNCINDVPVNLHIPPVQIPSIDSITTVHNTLCLRGNGQIEIFLDNQINFEISIDEGNTWLQNTTAINNLSAGIYELLIRFEGQTCSKTLDSIIIFDNPVLPEIDSITTESANNCLSNNGRIDLHVSDNSNYSYSIDQGFSWQNAPLFTQLIPGDYLIIIKDESSQCQQTATVSIEGITTFQLSVAEIEHPICEGDTTGSVTLQSYGGIQPIRWTWEDEYILPERTHMIPGIYTITATDNRGCSDSLIIEIYQPLSFDTIATLVRDTSLCPMQAIEYRLDFNSWTDIMWTTPQGAIRQSPIFTTEGPGQYNLVLVSPSGCIYEDSFFILQSTDLLEADFLMPTDALVGEPVVFVDITWPVPDSIVWIYDQDIQTIEELPTQEIVRFHSPGEYTVQLLAYYGGCYGLLDKKIRIHENQDSIPIPIEIQAADIIQSATVFPNPNTGAFQLQLMLKEPKSVYLWLFRPDGILAEQLELAGDSHYLASFQLTNDVKGVYTMIVQSETAWRHLHIIVQ